MTPTQPSSAAQRVETERFLPGLMTNDENLPEGPARQDLKPDETITSKDTVKKTSQRRQEPQADTATAVRR